TRTLNLNQSLRGLLSCFAEKKIGLTLTEFPNGQFFADFLKTVDSNLCRLLKRVATIGNTGYSSLLRNFLPKIPPTLLSLVCGGQILRIYPQRNHSQHVGGNAKNEQIDNININYFDIWLWNQKHKSESDLHSRQ